MTSIGSNVTSTSGAGTSSGGGPPVCAWVSLTLEEQLTNFKRIFCKQWPNIQSSNATFFESVATIVKALRIDPYVDIEILLLLGHPMELLCGTTPLHWAVLMDDKTMVRYILTSRRVDINASTRDWKETALHYAIIGGNHDIVEDLLEHKADVRSCNVAHRSALYYLVQRKKTMFGILKTVLANNVNMSDEVQSTALHYATRKGAIAIVTYLLEKKANVNLYDQYGSTPLHYATMTGSLDIVTCLLQQNANANALNRNGWSPLHVAAKIGDINIVSLLVEKNKDVDALTRDGLCPLHIATVRGFFDIVTYLVEYNANVNTLDHDGLCPLHMAATRGYVDIVTCLVEHNANVNALDHDGLCPLHMAATRGYVDIVTCLVEHNANVNALDEHGQSPLLLSIKYLRHDVSNELIAIGADVHIKDKCNNNALHLAIQAYSRKHNMMEIVKLLRERDVDANAKNSRGYSPFFAAVVEGHTEVVKELLQNKEKIKLMEECNTQTTIQIAFDNGYEHIKRALLECDDVSRYVNVLYRDRQVYVDAANAILVGAALIASVTFASWLQPPLGYTTSYLDLAPSSSDINYVDVQHNVPLRAFWVFNALSFYFAIGTVVFGARSVLPRRQMFIKDIVVKLHHNLLVTSILLACSVFFVIIAFGIAGCIVLTPTLQFQWYMIVPTIFGGLVCLFSLGSLFKSMVEDNLEKKIETFTLY